MTKPLCEFDGCERKRDAKGLCKAHYNQQWYGRPMTPITPHPYSRKPFPAAASLEEFFWLRVKKTADCWDWLGAENGRGYGSVNFQGEVYGAHRYSYELNVGPIRENGVIDHLCHRPICVNPDHLRVASHGQNMQNLRGAHTNSKSGERGVYLKNGRWIAQVQADGKRVRASFATMDEAKKAARAFRESLHH